MPFTVAQLTAFWTSQAQMGLTACMRIQMAAEGLTTPDDFEDFAEKDDLEGLFNTWSGSKRSTSGSCNVCYPGEVDDSSAWGANNCALLKNGGTHN